MYASRYVWDFRALHMEEQRHLVSHLLEEVDGSNSDNVTIDSTNSNLNEDVKCCQAFKLACIQWQSDYLEMKSAWKTYAEVLNQRPVPGKLYTIPYAIGGEDKDVFCDTTITQLLYRCG